MLKYKVCVMSKYDDEIIYVIGEFVREFDIIFCLICFYEE